MAPAAVRSLDEIGEVAEAFVAVHRSAVSVAVEQAVMRRNVNAMFVNLARRSQVLVERQLELLDDLEREESDPDQLDNLFKLDHLAARMRRNDESLLVLAGSESTRRWSRPVALPAVVLAAGRRDRAVPAGAARGRRRLHVVGHAVGRPGAPAARSCWRTRPRSPGRTRRSQVTARARAAGGAVIEIADEGLGMTPAALEQANALLAAPPAADVAASERMGLFVVSHLAARHGIQVRLRGGQRGWSPGAAAGRAARPERPRPTLARRRRRRMLTAAGRPAGRRVRRAARRDRPGRAAAPAPAGAHRRCGAAGPGRLRAGRRCRAAGRAARGRATRGGSAARASGGAGGRPGSADPGRDGCPRRPGGRGAAGGRGRRPPSSTPRPSTRAAGHAGDRRHQRAGPAGAGADGPARRGHRSGPPAAPAARTTGSGGGRRHAVPALQRGPPGGGRGDHGVDHAAVGGRSEGERQ